jgi:hypothetical protein
VGYELFSVIRVKGADPEVFWIIWIDPQHPGGRFMKTSQNLTEGEVLTELKMIGHAETEIDSLIKRARENPR